MLGRGPKAVNAGPRPYTGPKLKGGAEAQKWDRSPMRGQNPKAGPKPDAVNAEPEPDAGPKPDAVNAGGSSYPSVAGSQDAVERPDGLNHEGYLITTPSDHVEDNAG
ncbi:hypothetical protein CRG98_042588 [Punica granatum]|uniref:Uncharacterized protein n=1 Tax=Punica granatum TaxID=22663 RepID=A0A2I0HZ84_PUNGR|nr:hypothetical protein CRG98_042588 [Punica granatum]